MNTSLSYIKISKSKLISNIQAIRNFLHASVKLAVVVKGNAYGHGQNEVASVLEPYVDYFQVDDAQELTLLRKVTQKPIFVFGYVARHELKAALLCDGILAVYDYERLELLNSLATELGCKARVHIKIDASLGRQGLLVDQLYDYLVHVKKYENISVEGLYSHFANIEDTSDFSHAQKQLEGLEHAKNAAHHAGYFSLLTHISATSGIIAYEKNTRANEIVRLGIGTYGMWPSQDLKKQYKKIIQLQPVMRWVTHVAQIKQLPAGHSIGYGLTFVTTRPYTVALIPQGYSDGYDRGFSSNSEVLIRGKRCPVLGRVAMNMFTVDVTDVLDVCVEDEVVLLGAQGDDTITAEELGSLIGTINYEITTRVSPLLTRIIVD